MLTYSQLGLPEPCRHPGVVQGAGLPSSSSWPTDAGPQGGSGQVVGLAWPVFGGWEGGSRAGEEGLLQVTPPSEKPAQTKARSCPFIHPTNRVLSNGCPPGLQHACWTRGRRVRSEDKALSSGSSRSMLETQQVGTPSTHRPCGWGGSKQTGTLKPTGETEEGRQGLGGSRGTRTCGSAEDSLALPSQLCMSQRMWDACGVNSGWGAQRGLLHGGVCVLQGHSSYTAVSGPSPVLKIIGDSKKLFVWVIPINVYCVGS